MKFSSSIAVLALASVGSSFNFLCGSDVVTIYKTTERVVTKYVTFTKTFTESPDAAAEVNTTPAQAEAATVQTTATTTTSTKKNWGPNKVVVIRETVYVNKGGNRVSLNPSQIQWVSSRYRHTHRSKNHGYSTLTTAVPVSTNAQGTVVSSDVVQIVTITSKEYVNTTTNSVLTVTPGDSAVSDADVVSTAEPETVTVTFSASVIATSTGETAIESTTLDESTETSSSVPASTFTTSISAPTDDSTTSVVSFESLGSSVTTEPSSSSVGSAVSSTLAAGSAETSSSSVGTTEPSSSSIGSAVSSSSSSATEATLISSSAVSFSSSTGFVSSTPADSAAAVPSESSASEVSVPSLTTLETSTLGTSTSSTSSTSTPTTTSTTLLSSISVSSTASAMSSTPSAAPSDSPTEELSAFASECLDTHNEFRALHDAPAMSWNLTLSTYAETYLDTQQCNFAHSGGPYGENIAIGYATPRAAITAWYNEYVDYDYAAGEYSAATGHFTQVVWKASTQLGCALYPCSAPWGGGFLVCEYYPRGNIIGYFIENVSPSS